MYNPVTFFFVGKEARHIVEQHWGVMFIHMGGLGGVHATSYFGYIILGIYLLVASSYIYIYIGRVANKTVAFRAGTRLSFQI